MLTVFQPGAMSPATYSKHHLLLGFEQYTPGDSYTMLEDEPRIGLAICKDMDFHDIGHAYAVRNAQLLRVPASDFILDGWLHSRMAIMHGVESGFAMWPRLPARGATPSWLAICRCATPTRCMRAGMTGSSGLI
jgi:apolipoprotein N-acyltransferase